MQAERCPVVIASSGRSGSTWLLDVLARHNRMKTVFEPLHPCMGEISEKYAGRFVPPGADEPELESFLGQAVGGKLRHPFPNYRVDYGRLIPSWQTLLSRERLTYSLRGYKKLLDGLSVNRKLQGQGVVTKFIRANLMLDWIKQKFDVTVVHLVRNPVSVVASRMRNREHWDPMTQIQLYLNDHRLAASGFLDRYAAGFDLAGESDVHAMAAVWCIENKIPTSESSEGIDRVVFYEELLAEPSAWDSLAAACELKPPPAGEVVRPGRLKNWKGGLEDDQLREIGVVLDRFEIDIYSVSQARPPLEERRCVETASDS